MKLVSSVQDSDPLVQEISAVLATAEARLLALIRQGAQDPAALEEILSGLDQLAADVRSPFRRLDETLARRDLAFEIVERLQAMRRHWLWLYRKIRQERVFFAKIKIERGLRDTLYRQVIETTHQLSSLDEQEKALQAMDEEGLARDLLTEPELSNGESASASWTP